MYVCIFYLSRQMLFLRHKQLSHVACMQPCALTIPHHWSHVDFCPSLNLSQLQPVLMIVILSCVTCDPACHVLFFSKTQCSLVALGILKMSQTGERQWKTRDVVQMHHCKCLNKGKLLRPGSKVMVRQFVFLPTIKPMNHPEKLELPLQGQLGCRVL